MATALLLVHVVSTLAMVGLIWFVQLVHYPLMTQVGERGFCRYEREHKRRTTWVVAPFMLSELGSAMALLGIRPRGISLEPCIVGLALVAVIWISTAFWQVPIHGELSLQYRHRDVLRLVRSNWLRTVAWSARAAIVVWMLLEAGAAPPANT